MIFVEVPVSVLEKEIEFLKKQMDGAAPTAQTFLRGKLTAVEWVLRGGKQPHEIEITDVS